MDIHCFRERTFADNIWEDYKSTMERHKFTPDGFMKIPVVTDNGSNVISAFRHVLRFPCQCHNLHLCSKRSVEPYKKERDFVNIDEHIKMELERINSVVKSTIKVISGVK